MRALILTAVAALAVCRGPVSAQAAEPAQRLLEQGRLAEAEAAYRALIVQDPLEPQHQVGLARALLASGNSQGALIVLMPTAVRWMEMSRYKEAATLLEVAVEVTPESARTWSLLGRANALGRQYRAAEGALRTALQLGERDLMTLLILGSTLWENGSLGEAEELFVEALSASRGDTMLAQHQLASLWLWQGRFEEAAGALSRVVLERPGWIGARLDLARALQAEGRYEEARYHFEGYLTQLGDDPQARYGYASVLAKLGETELATEQMRISAELRESHRLRTLETGLLEASLDEAAVLLREAQPAEAEAILTPLPRTIEVLTLLSRARHAQDDLTAAIGLLEEAVAQQPGRVDLRAQLQALYAESGPTP